MLEPVEFKELLGPECDLDEEQIEKLRHQMHDLAEIIVDAALWDARKKREAAEVAAKESQEPSQKKRSLARPRKRKPRL